MYDIKRLFEPMSLSEAIEIYHNNPHLKIIAGGTDVLIHLHHGKFEQLELLSLQKVKELDEIKLLEDGTISIGAMTAFSTVFRSDLINQTIPVLAEASVSMGGPQIRNIATIGGNVCNGAVSADSAPTLFALNAKLRLVTKAGERVIPIHDFYVGPGKVKLNEGEILTEILINKDQYEDRFGNYIKFSNRKAMDIAMLSVAVVCQVNSGKFEDLRIALGVAAPTPIRCEYAEQFALGKEITDDVIKEIGELTLKSSQARNSWRGSKPYREHLINVLTQRAIKESIKRSGEDINE